VEIKPGESKEVAVIPLEQQELMLVAKHAQSVERTYYVPIMTIDRADGTKGVSYSRLHNFHWLLLDADGSLFVATVSRDGAPRLSPERSHQPRGFPLMPKK
jgi:hypothetical protein